MDISTIANALIEDLTNNVSMSAIMLKAQVLARCLGNNDFSNWVSLEQNGYDKIARNQIPSYRIVPCGVKANVSIPFRGVYTNLDVPIDGIQDSSKVEYFTKLYVTQPISEIESLATNITEGHLTAQLPAIAYHIVNSLYPTGNVEDCWQHCSPSEFCGIVDAVKSKLMNFILMFCDEGSLEVNPSSLKRKDIVQKFFNQTINNSIVNNGDGDVNANGATVGEINTISQNDVTELQKIVEKIHQECVNINDEDIRDELAIISSELEKKNPKVGLLRKAFRIIGSLAISVSANAISPLVDKAISIISTYFIP